MHFLQDNGQTHKYNLFMWTVYFICYHVDIFLIATSNFISHTYVVNKEAICKKINQVNISCYTVKQGYSCQNPYTIDRNCYLIITFRECIFQMEPHIEVALMSYKTMGVWLIKWNCQSIKTQGWHRIIRISIWFHSFLQFRLRKGILIFLEGMWTWVLQISWTMPCQLRT